MKRISTLLVAAAMFFGSVGAAQAVDVKVKGTFDFAFGWGVHTGFEAKNGDNNYDRDEFIAKQRVRTQVNFVSSEFLQGVLMFEIGNINWGRNNKGNTGQGTGGRLDADGVNVETKRAYIDWLVPNTDLAIRMGIQGLALPSATGFGNPVFDADVAAITASYQFNDMFGLTTFWARPFDGFDRDGNYDNDRDLSDELDMFGLILPITGEGWAFTPWGVIADVGAHSGFLEYALGGHRAMDDYYYGVDPAKFAKHGDDSAVAWWAGAGLNIDILDPLTFAMDFMYGRVGSLKGTLHDDVSDTYEVGSVKMAGWFMDARLDYKMDWGTPGIFGWYGSGDGTSKNKIGRLPVLGVDGGFNPTSFGLNGNTALTDTAIVSQTGQGTWGLGIQLADLSFVEDLTHTLRVAYYRGTNDKDAWARDVSYNDDSIYLTEDDSAWEVNLDSKYQIYENLAAYIELGYVHLDMDEWKNYEEDAWKAQVLFRYSF